MCSLSLSLSLSVPVALSFSLFLVVDFNSQLSQANGNNAEAAGVPESLTLTDHVAETRSRLLAVLDRRGEAPYLRPEGATNWLLKKQAEYREERAKGEQAVPKKKKE